MYTGTLDYCKVPIHAGGNISICNGQLQTYLWMENTQIKYILH